MLQLRQFRDADEEAVHELHEVAQDGIDAPATSRRSPTRYLTAGGEFLVGEVGRRAGRDGRAAPGLVRLGRDQAHARAPAAGRARASAGQLLDRLEARARELGFTTLRLDTTVREHVARALYEDAGYRMVGTGHENGFELVYYEKRLA